MLGQMLQVMLAAGAAGCCEAVCWLLRALPAASGSCWVLVVYFVVVFLWEKLLESSTSPLSTPLSWFSASSRVCLCKHVDFGFRGRSRSWFGSVFGWNP